MSKVRIFISSSMRELENEREIAREATNELFLEPSMFEGLPAMDKSVEDAYLDEIRKSHIFVLILWREFSDAVEREYNMAVECGIPVLLFLKMLGSEERRSDKLENFLRGEIGGTAVSSIPFYKQFRSLAQFKMELKEGLMEIISQKFTEPALTTSNIEEISRTALRLVQTSKRRLLGIVRTPIILFGPRPYDSEYKRYNEEEFYKVITSWIETMVEDENRRCLYLYSSEDLRKEMRQFRLEDRIMHNIKKYKSVEEETQGRFELSSIPEFPGKVLVGDNRFGIWFRGPKDKVVCVFREDANISKNLFETFYQYRGETIKTADDLLKEVGLA